MNPTDGSKCEITTDVNPVCNPAKTGAQSSPVQVTDSLCSIGSASNFLTTGANPTNYSWTCNNAGKSINCSASYNQNIPVCSPGSVHGTQSSPITSNTSGLCPAGQTVGGFTATTVGTTTSYAWSCNNSAVGGACSASYTCNPNNNTNFDLRIKKYAKSEDVFASVFNTEDFNYNIVVENRGTGSTSGITTVVDVLPSPVTLRATPTGNGWTCTGSAGSTSYTCTSSEVVTQGQLYPVITVPVRIINLAYRIGGYTNTAFVQNPNEVVGKRCFADNRMPTGNESQCTEDVYNTDPATINPPNPNGYDLRLKKYVNGDDNSTR